MKFTKSSWFCRFIWNHLYSLIFGVVIFTISTNQLLGQCLSSDNDFLGYANSSLSLDPIEGVWVGSLTIRAYRYNKLIEQRVEAAAENAKYIIRKSNDKYIMCLNGDSFALLTPTASESNFLFTPSFSSKRIQGGAEIKDSYRLKLSFTERDSENFGEDGDPYIVFEFNLIKTLPVKRSENPIVSKSGTAWALNSEGYVVTNYHVIEGGTSYVLKGVSDDVLEAYNLRLIAVDANNDLAILKVVEEGFSGFDKVPFIII